MYLAELAKRNTQLTDALRSHLVPVELARGDYDDLYEMFLEDRGKNIMAVLKEHVFDPRAHMLEQGA